MTPWLFGLKFEATLSLSCSKTLLLQVAPFNHDLQRLLQGKGIRFDIACLEVGLLIQRMCKDWDKQSPNMRKAWTYRDAMALHSVCGGFLYFISLLRNKLPASEFETYYPNMLDQFMMGFLDPDIMHALETSAPPSSMSAVAFLRLVAIILFSCKTFPKPSLECAWG